MCKILKVSASGFYGWRHRPVCQRQQANAALTAQIREAFVASDQTYGMPRIRPELQDAGIVRHRGKIEAVINNAKRAVEMAEQEGSLAAYLCGFDYDDDECECDNKWEEYGL